MQDVKRCHNKKEQATEALVSHAEKCGNYSTQNFEEDNRQQHQVFRK